MRPLKDTFFYQAICRQIESKGYFKGDGYTAIQYKEELEAAGFKVERKVEPYKALKRKAIKEKVWFYITKVDGVAKAESSEDAIKNANPTSLAELRKHLKRINPLIDIVRGHGYYYFVSDDAETSAKLHQNHEGGVYVYNCREMTFGQWEEELDQKLNHPVSSLTFGTEEE